MLPALVNPPRGLTGVERLVPAPRSAPFDQLFGRLPQIAISAPHLR
jgi:hypothetical protein